MTFKVQSNLSILDYVLLSATQHKVVSRFNPVKVHCKGFFNTEESQHQCTTFNLSDHIFKVLLDYIVKNDLNQKQGSYLIGDTN